MQDDGWILLEPEIAPLLAAGYLWGHSSVFQKQEVAAHRREAIILILEAYPSGLQVCRSSMN
jgi:hypothetical protein